MRAGYFGGKVRGTFGGAEECLYIGNGESPVRRDQIRNWFGFDASSSLILSSVLLLDDESWFLLLYRPFTVTLQFFGCRQHVGIFCLSPLSLLAVILFAHSPACLLSDDSTVRILTQLIFLPISRLPNQYALPQRLAEQKKQSGSLTLLDVLHRPFMSELLMLSAKSFLVSRVSSLGRDVMASRAEDLTTN